MEDLTSSQEGFLVRTSVSQERGAGLDGERSGLWTYFADAIRILRPPGVLVENVVALRRKGRGLDRVLRDLATFGYDAEWSVLRASDFGLPHKRERLFIIAYPMRERAQVSPAGSKSGSEVPRWPLPKNGYISELGSQVKPRMGREDDGLPSWVDRDTVILPFSDENKDRWKRCRALGNAVVPSIAHYVADILIDKISKDKFIKEHLYNGSE